MRETPLWKPSPERVESASLTAFLRQTGFADYPSLHEWSVESLDSFWKSVWKFTNVVGDPGETAFERGPDILSSRFFPQARLNLAENLLQRHGAAAAIIAIDENGVRRELSWAKLRCQVLAVAGALRNDGVEPGDRVVAWLPLIPEAVILLLATSAIGATFSSTSPDFGVGGVLDRFGQIEPKVLVAATGYQYGGKWFDCLERLREIQRGLGSLQQVVVVERDRADRGSIPDAVLWRDWIRSAEPLSTFESFPFDHPWLVLYSSGTTGKPKCIVHRAGGVFLNLKKEHILHCDVKWDDRLLYFTTTGWMMFNWLLNGLACGAALVLVDGSPFHPDPGRLFRIADQERVTLLGVSARFIDGVKRTGATVGRASSLERLRTIRSTGSPLSPEGFEWVYSNIYKE